MTEAGRRRPVRRGEAPIRPSPRRKPPLTGLAAIAAAMPETHAKDSLDGNLFARLEHRKLRCPTLQWQHNNDSRRTQKGWPDWVIAGPGGLLVRENKKPGEKPTREQQAWLDALAAAGLDVGVWTTMDLLTGVIDAELDRICQTKAGAPARRSMLSGPPGHAIVGNHPVPAVAGRHQDPPDKQKAPGEGGRTTNNFTSGPGSPGRPRDQNLCHEEELR